jgi:hypothetical protein
MNQNQNQTVLDPPLPGRGFFTDRSYLGHR